MRTRKRQELIMKFLHMKRCLERLRRLLLIYPPHDEQDINQLRIFLKCLWFPWQRGALNIISKFNLSDVRSIAIFLNSKKFLSFVLESTILSPSANYTLRRTFVPPLEAIFYSNINCPIPCIFTNQNDEEPPQCVPHILQGEIARLDRKFSVSMDRFAHTHNKKIITLICSLYDDHLPIVPPIVVEIPEKYPFASPECKLMEEEYLTTPFLSAVYRALFARIAKLPKCYSLSYLLDIWELSVRRAFSPNVTTVYDLEAIFGV